MLIGTAVPSLDLADSRTTSVSANEMGLVCASGVGVAEAGFHE